MAEVAPAPAKEAKKKAPKPKKTGPSVSELIVKYVSASKERSGVSVAAIKKLLASGGYDVEKNNSRVKVAIKSLVAKDILTQVKGIGASGSFKMNKKAEEKKTKKPAAKKAAPKAVKKPAAKKPAAAKKSKASAAKKPASAKKSPKKVTKPAAVKKSAKSPKKAAKSPKKTVKKAPAAKKASAAKKSPAAKKAPAKRVAKPKTKKAAPKKK